MPRPLLFAGWQVAVRREPKTPAKGGSVAQTEAGSGFRRLKANKKFVLRTVCANPLKLKPRLILDQAVVW